MNSTAGIQSTALLDDFAINHTRTGWKKQEEELLWTQVHTAREQGKALKSVFSAVAEATGRKPNSIRNYYYARAKQSGDELVTPSFIPFKQEEIWELLVTVLSEQAKGVSVRYCTLKMGGGDNRAMLRYQNKYRSLIKTNPELVKQVVRYMRKNNIDCFDPYANGVQTSARKVGRPRKYEEARPDIISEISNLLKTAAKADETKRQLEELQERIKLLSQTANGETIARLQAQEAEITRQSHTIAELVYAIKRITETGREFLTNGSYESKIAFAAELQRGVDQSSLMLA